MTVNEQTIERESQRLTRAEKAILDFIDKTCENDGYGSQIEVTRKEIKDITRLSDPSIRNSLTHLRQLRLIDFTEERQPRKSAIYRFTFTGCARPIIEDEESDEEEKTAAKAVEEATAYDRPAVEKRPAVFSAFDPGILKILRAEKEKGRIRENLRLSMERDKFAQLLWGVFRLQLRENCSAYRESEGLRSAIWVIASHFTTEHREFGIMLRGGYGNGKTTLAKSLQRSLNMLGVRTGYDNHLLTTAMKRAEDIAELAAKGDSVIDRIKRADVLIIDDMGKEADRIMHYGSTVMPIRDILAYRYAERLTTIVTTNMTEEETERRYGGHVADRLAEMMRVIEFEEHSYRRAAL